MTKKLYCYVDETGQDTQGAFFLVVVLVKDKDSLASLEKLLIDIEQSSQKRSQKWKKTHRNIQTEYLRLLLPLKPLIQSIYYAKYNQTKEYVRLTAFTIAKALLSGQTGAYEATVIIDGLNEKERDKVREELKKLKIKYRKIRGMKDEQSTFLRLADAMAGFLRDSTEKQPYAVQLMAQFMKKGIIQEI